MYISTTEKIEKRKLLQANEDRNFVSNIEKRFRCEKVNGWCEKEQCTEYNTCEKEAKIKFEEWKKKYQTENRETLELLCQGEV